MDQVARAPPPPRQEASERGLHQATRPPELTPHPPAARTLLQHRTQETLALLLVLKQVPQTGASFIRIKCGLCPNCMFNACVKG